MGKTLRLILGDQLNLSHSWFEKVDEEVVYCLFEMRQETDYVGHHIQKIIAFFLAMRAFKSSLEQMGHECIYLSLDDADNKQELSQNIHQAIQDHKITTFEYQLPDEYRLDIQLKEIAKSLSINTACFDTEHFMTSRTKLADMFEGKKTFLMERFYRVIRKEFDILMEGKEPITGRWNYDGENRKKLPKKIDIPEPIIFRKNVADIKDMIDQSGVKYIGTVDVDAFDWPISYEEGLDTLEYFCTNLLPNFGRYQDAMTPRSWSVFHSRLSFLMNAKILHPLAVCQRAIKEWERRPDDIDLAQLEGFVRQIMGWREYMRGIYWAKMPDYAILNKLEHTRALPSWYWTGDTKMNCLSHAIGQSLEHAYAHHIQRLMITGNFALLAGISPDEVDEWYLGIYIDALEWVEITNTRGMSQFADGGIVGSKPYVSSANYIHKMSDYCGSCHYDRKLRTGDKACPFNSLYWHFYERHREKLSRNPRISMMYRILDKMTEDDRTALLAQANYYLEHIDSL